MREEAKRWYDHLPQATKEDWDDLCPAFLAQFSDVETPEKLWQQLLSLQQKNLFDYDVYEGKFQSIWAKWVASIGGVDPDFLKKDRFIDGLFPQLKEKVKSRNHV